MRACAPYGRTDAAIYLGQQPVRPEILLEMDTEIACPACPPERDPSGSVERRPRFYRVRSHRRCPTAPDRAPRRLPDFAGEARVARLFVVIAEANRFSNWARSVIPVRISKRAS